MRERGKFAYRYVKEHGAGFRYCLDSCVIDGRRVCLSAVGYATAREAALAVHLRLKAIGLFNTCVHAHLHHARGHRY